MYQFGLMIEFELLYWMNAWNEKKEKGGGSENIGKRRKGWRE